MRIGLQTWGTEGDVAPFAALAEALLRAGHQVTLVYTALDDRELPPCSAAITVHRVGGPFGRARDPYALVRSTSRHRQLRALLAAFHEPLAGPLLEAGEALCRANDLVVGHMLNRTLHTAAVRTGTPRVSVAFSPQAIPGALPPLGRSWGRAVDAALWRMGDAAMTRTLYPVSDRLHRDRGLAPVRSLLTEVFASPLLHLVAASPALVPEVRMPQVRVTGAWTAALLPAELPPDLEAFLREGPPPVFLTFGSCTGFSAQVSGRLMVEAAALAGVRAVVQADPAHCPRTGGRDLVVVPRAPHALLFPRCAVVVHHGGAGTVHAVARAGVPSVVVPHGYDQDWWAGRLHALGAAPRPLPRRRTTAKALAAAVRQVLDTPRYAQAAERLRGAMAGEGGTDAAVAAIERCGLPG
ncbi:MAG: glycosyltransferase family 1 protein [Flavobacteriales bacterium]|nr:O-mycaminosyltylonolide 6-deoxyallosyltransferase [Flavobacteriales bacterium]MCC6577123.1 glycosyltransferase family 1 protein [Flavobacteriales bacterium]